MIRINLLGEKKDNTALHILQVLIFGLVVFVSVVVCFFVNSSINTELEASRREKTILETQLAKLRQKTKKVDELEKKKMFLADKLTTIASLKARRQGPVQLLDNITGAIPERAWLTDLAQSGQDIEFQGLAVDPQTVSAFMRDLQGSVFFKSVDLSYSRLFLRDGVKLQKFAVVAKVEDAIELQKKLAATDEGLGAEDSAASEEESKEKTL